MTKPYSEQMLDELRKLGRSEQWIAEFVRDAMSPRPTSSPRYVIPKSCWRPREGTGIPADAQMYPYGCPDPHWCRGNRGCFWDCKGQADDE